MRERERERECVRERVSAEQINVSSWESIRLSFLVTEMRKAQLTFNFMSPLKIFGKNLFPLSYFSAAITGQTAIRNSLGPRKKQEVPRYYHIHSKELL